MVSLRGTTGIIHLIAILMIFPAALLLSPEGSVSEQSSLLPHPTVLQSGIRDHLEPAEPDGPIETNKQKRNTKDHNSDFVENISSLDVVIVDNPFRVNPSNLNKRDVHLFENVKHYDLYEKYFPSDKTDIRNRRGVIEEDDIKNGKPSEQIDLVNTPKTETWIPQGGAEDDDLFDTKNNGSAEVKSMDAGTAEALTDKLNGRGARGATKDQWIKLPFLARPLENDQLSSSSPNLEDNHRMPRVNFVTQGKGLQTAESRNERESVPRGSYSRSSDIRTDIYPPEKDSRARSLDYSTYSRRSYYYPDDYRRGSYDDYTYYDDGYRREPYNERYDYKNGRRYDYPDYNRYRDAYDRYDGYDDVNSYSRYDKPRRIIYYANLPDVVRTPPNVYRYPNPYSRYDDDRYYRDSRYNDYRGSASSYYPNSRYPYSALKKSENEGPRDLTSSSSKEKSENFKRQEQIRKANEESARSRDNNVNSHQYPISLSTNMNVDDASKGPHQTLYHDITRMDSDFHRYDQPSFQAAVDDPYISRHD